MTDKKIDEVILFIGEEGKPYAEVQKRYGDKASAMLRELTSTASTPFPLLHESHDRYSLTDTGKNRLRRIQKELQWQARWEKTDRTNNLVLLLSAVSAIAAAIQIFHDFIWPFLHSLFRG